MIIKSPQLAEVTLSYKTKIKTSEMPQIKSVDDAAILLRAIWDEDKIQHVEQFVVLLMNPAGRLLGFVKTASGGIDFVAADRRLIFQAAILANATEIIIAHNHPCGNCEPSYEDIDLTYSLRLSCKFLSLELNDHIILTAEDFYSFQNNNKL